MSGAMVRCDRPLEHRVEPFTMEFDCAGNEITLLGEERGRQDLADGSAIIRLRFVEQQAPELARMARALFGSTHPRQSKETK
jgi:hypothetical protein